MMAPSQKIKKEYHFSVEGETETWYLERVQVLVNAQSKKQLVISSDHRKNPVQFVKTFPVPQSPIKIYHVCDMENQQEHSEKKFQGVLRSLKDASALKPSASFELAYSNIAFELWLILHKKDCNGSFSQCKSYLQHINDIFGAHFESLHEFKKEENFKNCLAQLTLEDVQSAIKRATKIQNSHEADGHKEREHCGYTYYVENPSLSIHIILEKILKEVL